MAVGTNAPHANEVETCTPNYSLSSCITVVRRTIRRKHSSTQGDTVAVVTEPNRYFHEAKMDFLTLSAAVWLDYSANVFEGVNLHAVIIVAENRQREGFWGGPTSQRVQPQSAYLKILGFFICSCFICLCIDVYMQSNAWQRSCVRNPAIKKAQGAEGGRRKPAEEGRGRAVVEEASVFLQERGCRAKSTWKSREMGERCRERLQHARIELQKPALSFTRPSSHNFCSY